VPGEQRLRALRVALVDLDHDPEPGRLALDGARREQAGVVGDRGAPVHPERVADAGDHEQQADVRVREDVAERVGDPVAGVLEHARAKLDVGDLAGAVAEVGALQGAPAQAMAAWLAQARSLLEARAALATWAAAG